MNDQLYRRPADQSTFVQVGFRTDVLAWAKILANAQQKTVYVYHDPEDLRVSEYFYKTRRLIQIIEPEQG